LSREDGEALITRLEADALTAEDRRGRGEVLPLYFLVLFGLRGAKLSVKPLKTLVFGGEAQKRQHPGTSGGGGGGGGAGGRGGAAGRGGGRGGKTTGEAECRRAGTARSPCPPARAWPPERGGLSRSAAGRVSA